MSTYGDLVARLAAHVARLESGELDGEANKRARKRVQAKIGACKKELAALGSGGGRGSSGGAGLGGSSSEHGATPRMPPQRRDDGDLAVVVATSGKAAARAANLAKTTKGQARDHDSLKSHADRSGKRRRVDEPASASSSLSAADGSSIDSFLADASGASVDEDSGVVGHALAAPTGKLARKKKLKQLNSQLAQLAQRKQLAAVKKAFARAERKGLVDTHSFASLMNAHVRCGDVDGSAHVLARLRDHGLVAGVVHYTVHLKGLCAAGRINDACALLAQMTTNGVQPNLRTLDTFLRGCVRAGETDRAVEVFAEMRSKHGVEPDASSYEALASLLATQLRLEELRGLIDQLQAAARRADESAALRAALAGEVDAAANPAIHLCAARAAAMLAEWDHASAAADAASAECDHDRFLHRQQLSAAATDGSGGGGGGARGGRERGRSMRQFARHRLDEIRRETDAVEAFADQRRASGVSPSEHGRALLDVFGRLLHFGHAYASPLAAADLPAHLVSELERFGLARAVRLLGPGSGGGAARSRELATRFAEATQPDARVDLRRLFKNPKLPLKLELCSGSGEWVAAQAAGDAGRVNWAALELRHDRVYDCFARAVLGGLDNLCVLGGNADVLLRHHVLPRCAHSVYINHPEPPERTGGADDSEGKHLLTTEFFTVMREILAPGGHVTVVTDNKEYGRSVAVAATAAGYRAIGGMDVFQGEAGGGGVELLDGLPGPEAGHSVEASSYFDRLWNEGNKVARYWFAAVPS